MRRLGHTDPHVVIQAITLLDACVSNCGKPFHLEVASREFETEFRRLMLRQQPAVAQKMAGLLKKWSEEEFKGDPQLSLIPSLYAKLKSEGVDFPESTDTKAGLAKAQPLSKDPNVVSSQQEMDDIAKAIELSLKESPMKHATSSALATNSYSSSSSSANKSSTSLYPSTASLTGSSYTASQSAVAASEARKVRALYDFEAAEDNELNFMAGDIIHVTDDSDPNWWKGYNQRGEGLFPASFVTADLSVEPESLRLDLTSKSGGSKKSVQFADDVKEEEQHLVEINEEKLDRLLHLLHEANPEDPSTDTAEMLKLEQMVNQMGPLIDTELERVDRTHAQLARLSVGLVDAFNLYHTLMRESEKAPHYMGGGGFGNAQVDLTFNLPPLAEVTTQSLFFFFQGMYGQPQSMPGMMGMGPGNMFPTQQQQQQHHQQHHHQPQPGMPYMPGMGTNGPAAQFPVASGPTSMPMMGPSVAASQQQQQQLPQGMHHPQMQNSHPMQQQQQHHHQSPVHNGQGHPMSSQHQQPMNANTVTSSSAMSVAPITNAGQPPSAFGPPGGIPYPPGPAGGMAPGHQPQQFNPGMQFHPPVPNGGSPHHGQPPPPSQPHQPPTGHNGPQMGAGGPPVNVQQQQQMGQFNPMMQQQQQPLPVTTMMHPHPHQPMSMGADMNIPIYQQR